MHPICYEVLSEAGVISEKTNRISEPALGWLGQDHIEWMQEEFRQNGSFVGQSEYCVNQFPDSSLVTLAAKLFVACYVTQDDFSAGY